MFKPPDHKREELVATASIDRSTRPERLHLAWDRAEAGAHIWRQNPDIAAMLDDAIRDDDQAKFTMAKAAHDALVREWELKHAVLLRLQRVASS